VIEDGISPGIAERFVLYEILRIVEYYTAIVVVDDIRNVEFRLDVVIEEPREKSQQPYLPPFHGFIDTLGPHCR